MAIAFCSEMPARAPRGAYSGLNACLTAASKMLVATATTAALVAGCIFTWLKGAAIMNSSVATVGNVLKAVSLCGLSAGLGISVLGALFFAYHAYMYKATSENGKDCKDFFMGTFIVSLTVIISSVMEMVKSGSIIMLQDWISRRRA